MMNSSVQLNPLHIESIVQKIQSAKSIILSTHKQCDGDGLGAILALYHALKKAGKKVRALTVDDVPKKYSFLSPHKHLEVFERPHQPIEPTDLALIFDTNDRRLVEPLWSTLDHECKEALFVDHHPVLASGPEPTKGSYIDTHAASTGEISFFIIKALGIPLDEDIALALYTSISFDTQLFKFVKSSANSHLIAAELISFVKHPEEIHRHLFATHTREKIAFLSLAFGQVEYFADGRIAILKLKSKDLEDHHLDMDDSRDVIDMIMNVHALEAAALFREDKKNEYKLSLRSKGRVEVLDVAEAFGGGGHIFASGAYLIGDFEALKLKVVELLLENIDRTPPHKTELHARRSKKIQTKN